MLIKKTCNQLCGDGKCQLNLIRPYGQNRSATRILLREELENGKIL